MLLALTPYAALIGLFAVIYRHILAYEDILNWWFRFGSRYERRWFWKPVWGCEICISGQLALWTYALNWFCQVILSGKGVVSDFVFFLTPIYHQEHFSVLGVLIFVCEAVAFAYLFNKALNKLNN